MFSPQSATVLSIDPVPSTNTLNQPAIPAAAPSDPGSPAVFSSPSSPASPSTVNDNPALSPILVITQSQTAESPKVLSLAGQAYTFDLSSNVVIGSQTIRPGSAVTVAGTPISPAPSGSYVVVGSSIIPLTPQAQAPNALIFAGQTYTANSASAFVIDGQTLNPGAAVTISGTPVSLPPSATYALVGSSKLPFITAPPTPPVLTVAGQVYSANSASDFVIGGQVLTPGGVITISGTPVSLPVSGGVAIVAGSTVPLITSGAALESLTISGQTFTANLASGFVIDDQTLTPGGVITVSGTRISLATTDVVIGTSTEGLASLILNGFGTPRATTGPTVVPFRGAANRARSADTAVLVGVLVGIWGLFL